MGESAGAARFVYFKMYISYHDIYKHTVSLALHYIWCLQYLQSYFTGPSCNPQEPHLHGVAFQCRKVSKELVTKKNRKNNNTMTKWYFLFRKAFKPSKMWLQLALSWINPGLFAKQIFYWYIISSRENGVGWKLKSISICAHSWWNFHQRRSKSSSGKWKNKKHFHHYWQQC